MLCVIHEMSLDIMQNVITLLKITFSANLIVFENSDELPARQGKNPRKQRQLIGKENEQYELQVPISICSINPSIFN